MKKAIYLKSIFLLCLLLAGAVSAHADGYDYDCVKVTDLSDVSDDETVLLVDESKNLALSPLNGPYGIGLKGVDVAIGEDNVVRNVSADMIWTIGNKSGNSFTFNNNGKPLWGSLSSSSVSVTNEPYGQNTSEFFLDEYGDNGGKLYYVGNNNYDKAYFIWNSENEITIDSETGARFTLYKVTVKNYVKWKKVNWAPADGSDVAIVDLTTGRAMSNDKDDKDPDAVAVTLNDDKDRIIGEVAEKLQWKVEVDQNNDAYRRFAAGEGKYLYADGEQLKVGEGENNLVYAYPWYNTNPVNSIPYMSFKVGDDYYFAGVEESMFSNTWKLKKYDRDNHKVDDAVKDTRYAYFKKIEDHQKIVNIELPEYYNYDLGKFRNNEYIMADFDFEEIVTITGADKSEIKWKSSNPSVATINAQGAITLKGIRGTTVITAYVEEDTENYYHDKASAKCTVIVDDGATGERGSMHSPLTVAEAKELAETGKLMNGDIEVLSLEEGVNYYIKGKVSKVNSGMMAMFGDMDFGEMMGDSGSEDSMDDMDFDPEDMEESGFDMSSFDMSSLGFDMSAMFGTSDKVTYYISDDGTKDGQMKVINGCGTLKEGSTGAMEFNPIPKLSPGDCVVVCGPLVYTEDTSMFSSFMGGGDDEPEMSGKVDEMNYLAVYDPTLLVQDREIYVDKTLKVVDGGYTAYTLEKGLYSIDNLFDKYDGYNDEVKISDLNQIKEATFKSSDEEIAKWDEDKKELVGVNEGKAKITVKVKVVLQEADDNANPKVKERSYTMKRKFKIVVKTRDLDPAGYYDGDYVLTKNTDDLEDGTRIILVSTRVKDDKETDYVMVENNAMMGGGKNGSKFEFKDTSKEKIACEDRPKGTFEVVLEKDENNADIWYLNVGEDENGTPLYLYASDSSEVEEEGEGEGDDEGGDNKFDINKIMEMFNSSSGLKVGTRAEATSAEGVDSCMATITFNGDIATIKFINVVGKNKAGNTVDKSNTIMLSSSFDMEEMMNMFSSTGEGEDEEGQEESGSTFDMGSFDMFMAAFNTKKPGDEKSFMPRIYRFVPDPEFDVPIGDAGWKTIVTYKDVKVPENVKAYVATDVIRDDAQTKAILSPVEKLKGGEPYLLYTEAGNGNYTMTLLTEDESEELSAPEKNLLLVSDRKTAGEKGNTSVYVLANKDKGVGFYRWTGGQLGKGRVYLPVEASVAGADEFCSFSEVETTAIREIDSTDSKVRTYYDLQGRRVLKPTKGVYIVDGKKQVVK
jgi:hypothetical protein